NTRFTAAASSDSPNESSSACSTRGLVMMRMKRSNESSVVLRNRAASGTSTISDNHSKVVPSVIPKPGIARRPRTKAAPLTEPLASWAVDGVEHAAIVEVLALCLAPTAERLVDRDQIELRELVRKPLGDCRVARTIEMAGGDLLTLRGVDELEKGLGGGA